MHRVLFLTLLFISFFNSAFATDYELNQTSCQGALFSAWSGSTCTVSQQQTIPAGDHWTIPSNMTLEISNTSGTGITNNGQLTNRGTILVANVGRSEWFVETTGILNNGSLINYGDVYVTNSIDPSVSYPSTVGIRNEGTLTNHGNMEIENTPLDQSIYSVGLMNRPGSIINNGTIKVANDGIYGLYNWYASIINNGDIEVANAGWQGIRSEDANFINTSDGTITVSEQLGPGFGIVNANNVCVVRNATINNFGEMAVNNEDGTGIYNGGGYCNPTNAEVINNGDIEVANAAGTGIVNNNGVLTNTAMITIENDGGIGIDNQAAPYDTLIYNFGLIELFNLEESIGINNQATAFNCGMVDDDPVSPAVGLVGNPFEGCVVYLMTEVESSDLATNVEKSLLGPLKKADAILTDGNDANDGAACDKLDEFIANVESKEASGKLDSGLAEYFTELAEYIQEDVIGCL